MIVCNRFAVSRVSFRWFAILRSPGHAPVVTVDHCRQNALHDLADKLGLKRGPGNKANYHAPHRKDEKPSLSIFDAKGFPYVLVEQVVGGENLALKEWTAQTSGPVAVWHDERPRTTWIEQLYLAERIAPYKRPRSLEITTERLRDDAGKVRRSALRAERMQAV